MKGECVYVCVHEREREKRETPALHEVSDSHEYLTPLAVAEVTAISTSVLPYWHN